MNAIRKSLLCAACMLMAFTAMGRGYELSRQESDSVSHALATMWSASYRNILANDGKEVAAEFMRGVQDALGQTKSDGQEAYNVGWQQGQLMNQRIKDVEAQGRFTVNMERLKHVLTNVTKGRSPGFSNETAQIYLNRLMKKIAEWNYRVDGSEEYLRKTAEREGVIKTASGLLFEVISEGEGECPDANDMVYVKFVCRLIDGKEVSRSDKENNTILNIPEAIKGFGEGLQMMKIGGKYRLHIPSELGYGEYGSRNIPGGAAAIFDVELLDYRQVDEDGNFGDSVMQNKMKKEL